jgi:hypothetical protein
MRILFILLLLFLFTCEKETTQIASEPELVDDKDIWSYGDENFQQGQYFFLDLSKMENVKLGKTTEQELYKIFGKKVHVRLSFTNKPLPKKYKGNYIRIDKLIKYFDAIGTETEIPNGKKYETFERLAVTFYLYKNRIQFYSIYNEDVTLKKMIEKNSTKDVLDDVKKEYGSFWPNQGCDRDFYDHTVLKVNKPYDKNFPCEWHEASFEKKLKEDGYYELLKGGK